MQVSNSNSPIPSVNTFFKGPLDPSKNIASPTHASIRFLTSEDNAVIPSPNGMRTSVSTSTSLEEKKVSPTNTFISGREKNNVPAIEYTFAVEDIDTTDEQMEKNLRDISWINRIRDFIFSLENQVKVIQVLINNPLREVNSYVKELIIYEKEAEAALKYLKKTLKVFVNAKSLKSGIKSLQIDLPTMKGKIAILENFIKECSSSPILPVLMHIVPDMRHCFKLVETFQKKDNEQKKIIWESFHSAPSNSKGLIRYTAPREPSQVKNEKSSCCLAFFKCLLLGPNDIEDN